MWRNLRWHERCSGFISFLFSHASCQDSVYPVNISSSTVQVQRSWVIWANNRRLIKTPWIWRVLNLSTSLLHMVAIKEYYCKRRGWFGWEGSGSGRHLNFKNGGTNIQRVLLSLPNQFWALALRDILGDAALRKSEYITNFTFGIETMIPDWRGLGKRWILRDMWLGT